MVPIKKTEIVNNSNNTYSLIKFHFCPGKTGWDFGDEFDLEKKLKLDYQSYV